MTSPDPHKVPPQNIEAEQSILGGVLLENDALYRALETVSEEDFYKPSHQKIFSSLVSLSERGEPADLVTLTQELKKKGHLDQVGGSSYLASMINQVPTAANISHYAKIVREKAVLRQLISVSSEIISKGYQDTADLDTFLDHAEKAIFDISNKRFQKGFEPIREIVKASFKTIEYLSEKKESITGVPSGFSDLDRLTSGFQPSDLIIIAARPSMGKTSLALNMAQYASVYKKVPIVIFSLEMSKEQLVTRMLTSLAKVDAFKLRIGRLQDNDWPKLTKAAGQLSEAPIFIDDSPTLSVLEVRAKCRRLKVEHNIGMIMIDYLQLMRGNTHSESREKEVSEISRGLKALAKELSVPVVALAQLNRALENRNDKRPLMADLRESGALEQDADLIGFIYRDEVYNKESDWKGTAEFILSKQRSGPTGVVRLAFLQQHTSFENLAPQEMPMPEA
ncbi:MAG: replicative DNA helicase [Deltaproteobacteria bacterium RIFCSPHIGHO2_02_FULL_40_11]|nr:MAG: replicative DNA helicase [Deltaproteobacteria bacterium RIFCSPHIGHO2_02_FULL_40_11]